MTESDDCTVSMRDMKRIAGDLNEFVVTFDQIFSRMAFGEAGPDLLVEYMLNRDVRARLAEARKVVFEVLERELGEEAADDIGESGFRYFG
ncbi:hypothetical protein [Actinoplanes derwentensis]|uniref:hypothetical protein n=1 Tax=Actinoplanes derwentensis TaxID=113562 RepID=UPI0012FD45A1|nr:hypothetical protein [Actinoplanes derwentensis]GID86333.1 hypothetical protein Ade03nite_52570 [Actinoplanes derwentensis]